MKPLFTGTCDKRINWTAAAGLIAAAGAGAGLMYFLDPQRGTARRARLRDRTFKLVRQGTAKVDKNLKYLANKVEGVAAEVRHSIQGEEPPSDTTLAARIKSRLGRITTHAHAIQVEVAQGKVVLAGPVLVNEGDKIVHEVKAVPGVVSVANGMAMYESLDAAPKLAGDPARGSVGILVPTLLGIGSGILTALQTRAGRA